MVLILGFGVIRCGAHMMDASSYEQRAAEAPRFKAVVGERRATPATGRASGLLALAGGAGWTGTVWGLYFLAGWIRKGFGSTAE